MMHVSSHLEECIHQSYKIVSRTALHLLDSAVILPSSIPAEDWTINDTVQMQEVTTDNHHPQTKHEQVLNPSTQPYPRLQRKLQQTVRIRP